MSKLQSLNAELIIRVVRGHLGLFIFALLWGFWGWAVWGVSLAVAMLSWVLLLGPLFFLSLLFFRHPFFSRNLFKLDLNKQPVVLKQYFRMILNAPGPKPVFFVVPSRDKSLSWLSIPFSKLQHVYVTSAWLDQDAVALRAQIEEMWMEIASQSQVHRWIRSLEWAVWCSALLPLDLSLNLLDIGFRFFGVRGLPRSAFWAQRLCWHLKRLWFYWPGKKPSDDGPLFQMLRRDQGNIAVPKAWHSLTWGVWTRLVPDDLHPSWAVLTDSDAFFVGKT